MTDRRDRRDRRALRGDRRPSRSVLLLIGTALGAAVGSALLFFVEPGRGALRRHLVRDKAGHAVRRGRWAVHREVQDLENRAHGVLAVARGRLRREQVDDQQLEGRIRARLGHSVEHPHAVEVSARSGFVTLRGRVPSDQVARIRRVVRRTRGVMNVRDLMRPQVMPSRLPSLQR